MGYFLRKLHTEGDITEKQEEKIQSCPLTVEVQLDYNLDYSRDS